MAYAYYDKSGILHVVEHLGVAVENCKGIVVETDIPCDFGFPVVDGKQIVFDNTKGKCYARDDSGEKIEVETPRVIEDLVDKIFMNEYSFANEKSSPPIS